MVGHFFRAAGVKLVGGCAVEFATFFVDVQRVAGFGVSGIKLLRCRPGNP